ncbi:hypothetical protein JKF63_04778 [Porcisia hertigi]|uniref:Uncharacterized protein n=1 Tax=Porcisia hertigi TaxID=2761500 RepID=A0A836IMS6_9TRYP|nr:hypothetical protein JKF63_04778 [Porcisia hertigi]
MGGRSSKERSGTVLQTPALTPEAVDTLCREAYAAGVSDSDMYHTSRREVIRQEDMMAGIGACLLSGWVAYVYGRTTGVRMAEDAATLRFDVQQGLLDKASKELALKMEENHSLIAVRQEQDIVIAKQRDELQRAAQQRRAMQQAINAFRRRNASVQRQLRGLESSLVALQRQIFVSMAGAGLTLLGVIWATRPLRKGLEPYPPVAAASVAVEATSS